MKYVLIAAAIVFLLSLAVFAVRLLSVLEYWDLFRTVGDEELHVYGIWKVQRGFPLYEYPDAIFYGLTGYNYLFYFFYAAVLSVFNITNSGILLHGKLLTLSFAVFGSFMHWRLMCYLARPYDNPASRVFFGIIAFIVWFGTHITGWWAMTTRPDIPAAALAVSAFFIFLRGYDENSARKILAASVLFFLAWSFKQSYIWIFAGTVLYLLVQKRDWRRSLELAVPWSLMVMAVFLIGGDNYKINTVAANLGQNPSLAHFLYMISRGLLVSPFFWAFWPYLLLVIHRSGGFDKIGFERVFRQRLVPLVYMAVIALAGSGYALTLIGTNRNQLIEASIVASTLSSVLLSAMVSMKEGAIRSKAAVAATSLILCMAVFPAAQLIFFNKIGCLALATKEEHRQKRSLGQYFDTLPKPLFNNIYPFDLPWYSTNGEYPVVIFDALAHLQFKKLYGGGISGLAAIRHFRSLVINRDDCHTYYAALKAGYTPRKMPDIGLSYMAREWNFVPKLLVLVLEDAPGEAKGGRDL